MAEATPVGRRDPAEDEDAFRERMLRGVSRTFALTIPELPVPLRRVVGTAYLLCRIADTVEDEPGLALERKRALYARFVEALAGTTPARAFADEFHSLLTERTPPAERELARGAHRVIHAAHGFGEASRDAVVRCVRTMCAGMLEFEARRSLAGLRDVAELDRYCYFVAGVVGELLTELFCAYAPELDRRRTELMPLAVSFGQGLQLTNILKDVWEDRARGTCWLPRTVFRDRGCELARLPDEWGGPACAGGLAFLIGLARGRLAEALEYTLLIPPRHRGIRQFCLWALGMAVLTLRKIHRRPDFRAGDQVKISRRSVRATVAVAALAGGRDRVLVLAFRALTRGLPPVPRQRASDGAADGDGEGGAAEPGGEVLGGR